MGNRIKFATEIGQCASMEKVEGQLVIREENDNVFLAVKSEGLRHGLHQFCPQSSIWKRVVVIRKDSDLIIRFLG